MDRREKEEAVLYLEQLIDKLESEEVDRFQLINAPNTYTGQETISIYIVFKHEQDSPEDYQDLEDSIMGLPISSGDFWQIMKDLKSVPEEIKIPFQKVVAPSTNPCEGCSNHPSNGGSGVCHCVLPYVYTYCTDQ